MVIAASTCFHEEDGVGASEPSGRGASSGEESVLLGNYQMTLDGCALRYRSEDQSGTLELALPDPCSFSLNSEGGVRIVETQQGRVIAVESSRAAKLPGGRCDTRIRAIVLAGKALRLSARTQRVAQCLPAVWDELMFHAFAAETLAAP